jgi:hypothetical protein
MLLWWTLIVSAAAGALREPAGMGAELCTMGTIRWGNGVTGRQPWIAAAFMRDTADYGCAGAGTVFYDRMDNFRDRYITQAAAGAWVTHGAWALKIAYLHFDALEVYHERQGFVSLGFAPWKRVRFSIEANGYHIGVTDAQADPARLLHGGASIWIPWSFASVSLAVDRIALVRPARPGFETPMRIMAGMHTEPHRFGAQGVLFRFWHDGGLRAAFAIGQQYWLHPNFAIDAAVSTDPIQIAIGLMCEFRSLGVAAGLLHHPALGWSKGAMAEYRGASMKHGRQR